MECGFDSFFNGVGCEDTDLAIRMEKSGFVQGIGTALTRRKQSAGFFEIFKKFLKYGKGDAHIVVKYPVKLKNILFHQLVRYPLIKPIQSITNDGFKYIPFFILFGLTRFFSMLFSYSVAKKKGRSVGYN
jgi:hypothetical protein